MAIVNFLWTGGKLHKSGPWGKSLKTFRVQELLMATAEEVCLETNICVHCSQL